MVVLHHDDVSYKTCRTAPRSEHIVIRGVGDRLGDGETFLFSLLERFGRVRNLELPRNKSHIYATMDTIETCDRIRDGLNCLPELADRQIRVQFCKRRGDPFEGLNDVRTDLDQDGAVPGLRLIRDYISADDEHDLIQAVDQVPYWTRLDLRQVAHFGNAFDYDRNEIDPYRRCDAIDGRFRQVADRLHADGLIPDAVDQLTVNRYGPGAGIPPHIDRHSAFGAAIASVSLLGDTVVTFIDAESGRNVDVFVPRRALFVMTGESRYRWRHTIRARHYDRLDGVVRQRTERVSLTFRTVNRSRQCDCSFRDQCDRHDGGDEERIRPDCDEDLVHRSPQVEIDYVHGFYDQIADHFSSTRYKPWPLVEKFMRSLPPCSLIADIGCGNGKYVHCHSSNSVVIGFDRCERLIDHCKQRLPSPEVGIADALYVPLRTASMDAAVSVAVLHHISNVKRRLLLLSELIRIVRPGALILVVAWAMEQDVGSRRRFTDRDCFVPWQKTSRWLQDGDAAIVQRFCHMYEQGEIPELVAQLGDVAEVVSEFYDASNWLVTIRKRDVDQSAINTEI